MANTSYSLAKAFAAIENQLINSMIRNMKRHRAEETDEGIQWSQWQAEQLKALETYRKVNKKNFGERFEVLNGRLEELLRATNEQGMMDQEEAILNAIKNGFTGYQRSGGGISGEFFRANERKLNALVNATTNDMQKAETAVLRMANDQYRKIIYNAQVFANTGAGTYEQAVDMATKDMLSAGLNCVQYANGSRHTLSDYADMAIKTANKRAYLQGEGTKRQEWGEHLVIMAKRGNPCPKCLPFVGKILIDDVWSGGSRKDGKYPLMSTAIKAGLYHPRCKDSHTTYFPGITTAKGTWTKKELEAIEKDSKEEARQQYAEHQEEKYTRLADGALDPENKEIYDKKVLMWKRAESKTDSVNSQENVQLISGGCNKYYLDTTSEWKAKATPDSHSIVDLNTYVVDGIVYKVDGKHVVLDYAAREKEIAELLEKEFGGEIAMVPRVLNPTGISTPDYIFRGEAYDLKELSGKSNNLIYNAISKKKRQAANFVLDISMCPLPENEILKQVENIYWSRHTRFVDKLVLVKGNQVIHVFSRQK